jgi:hypothetical protein
VRCGFLLVWNRNRKKGINKIQKKMLIVKRM